MAGELKGDDGSSYRAFVCHTLNSWGYPAKDRSGRLHAIEEPNLGRLMEKIAGPTKPAPERLDFARPASSVAPLPEDSTSSDDITEASTDTSFDPTSINPTQES